MNQRFGKCNSIGCDKNHVVNVVVGFRRGSFFFCVFIICPVHDSA